jgi:hypothetical protein
MLWDLAIAIPNETDAARSIGIGVTRLKAMCRVVNLRWPGRKIQALQGLLVSSHVTTEDVAKIKFFIRSAPWHKFNFSSHTAMELFMIRRRVYKMRYKLKSLKE